LGTAAASPIHSGIVGIERRISMMRWITESIAAAEVPETPPSTTPSTRLSATLTRPIVIDVRVANMSRDHRSRPCVSVPMRNIVSPAFAPSTPKRCRSVG
jgi:hypothetical protein